MNSSTNESDKPLDEIADVLTDLVKAVVRNPDGVKVSHLVRGSLVAYVIKTDQDDVRRVIGSKGKHFRALETLVREATKRLGRESHLAIDEKAPPPGVAPRKESVSLGEFNAKRFKDMKDLLSRTIALLVGHKPELSSDEVGTLSIFEVKVKAADYKAVYGVDAPFDEGRITDGHIIGAIKNFFDGIGKNNGRVIKLTLTQV
jgi:predicted RNA-binding protein YlqC (UPF0109 family)